MEDGHIGDSHSRGDKYASKNWDEIQPSKAKRYNGPALNTYAASSKGTASRTMGLAGR